MLKAVSHNTENNIYPSIPNRILSYGKLILFESQFQIKREHQNGHSAVERLYMHMSVYLPDQCFNNFKKNNKGIDTAFKQNVFNATYSHEVAVSLNSLKGSNKAISWLLSIVENFRSRENELHSAMLM